MPGDEVSGTHGAAGSSRQNTPVGIWALRHRGTGVQVCYVWSDTLRERRQDFGAQWAKGPMQSSQISWQGSEYIRAAARSEPMAAWRAQAGQSPLPLGGTGWAASKERQQDVRGDSLTRLGSQSGRSAARGRPANSWQIAAWCARVCCTRGRRPKPPLAAELPVRSSSGRECVQDGQTSKLRMVKDTARPT